MNLKYSYIEHKSNKNIIMTINGLSLSKDTNDNFAFATEFTNEIFIFDSQGNQVNRIEWDSSYGKIWSLSFFNIEENKMLAVASEDNLVFLSLEVDDE